MWDGVHFGKVLGLQHATLLLANSFIKNKLLYRYCSSFFVLFRNLHSAKSHLVSGSFYVNCEIRKMSRKPSNDRSRPEMLCKIGVLKNFANFTWKHLWQSPLLSNFAGWGALFYRTPPVTASWTVILRIWKKKQSSQTKSFVPNNLFTMHLTDYLKTKHSMFFLEIKQRTHQALLMLQTLLSLPLWS